MPRIGAAAAAQHGERRHPIAQRNVAGGEVVRIALVEPGSLVEFGNLDPLIVGCATLHSD